MNIYFKCLCLSLIVFGTQGCIIGQFNEFYFTPKPKYHRGTVTHLEDGTYKFKGKYGVKGTIIPVQGKPGYWSIKGTWPTPKLKYGRKVEGPRISLSHERPHATFEEQQADKVVMIYFTSTDIPTPQRYSSSAGHAFAATRTNRTFELKFKAPKDSIFKVGVTTRN